MDFLNASPLGFWWAPCTGGARIFRVFGDTPCPILPNTVAGLPVVEIGSYCFSASEKSLAKGQTYTCGGVTLSAPPTEAHPICGDFITAVTLPDSVRVLDSAAFYNCRKLETLSMGSVVASFGSDLFTNCRKLETFSVRSEPNSVTGLRKLLITVSADVAAQFEPTPGAVIARLFYPEYTETLDVNLPAHIFNHTLEGEGYRYRQCFSGEVLQFAEYDAAFARALVSESTETLCRVAFGRLQYPHALDEAAAAQYKTYLAAHAVAAAKLAVAKRSSEQLRLLANCLPDAAPSLRAELAALCSAAGWGEGAALLLVQESPRRKKTYDFDDF